MISIISRKYFYLVIILILSVCSQSVFSNDAFQNNLLKTDISKNSIGGVKVTLYTSKPYKDSVYANKKNDYEYVIYMPETANSLTAKPVVTPASDVIKNIDVKTQQYANNIKGYTKITISTTKPIEIVPQVQTLNSSVISESDYSELLSQKLKKQSKTLTKNDVSKTIYPKKIINRDSKELGRTALVNSKLSQKSKVARNSRIKQEISSKSLSYSKNIKNSSKKLEKDYKQEPQAESKIKEKTITDERINSEHKLAENVNNQASPENTQSQQDNISTSEAQIEKPTENIVTEQAVKTNVRKRVYIKNLLIAYVPFLTESRLHNAKIIFKDNFYYILAIGAISFIILLLIARKMFIAIKNKRKKFSKSADLSITGAEGFSEEKPDDTNWKEKLQMDSDSEIQAQANVDNSIEIKPIQKNEQLDELFSQDNKSDINIEEQEPDISPKSVSQANIESLDSTDLNLVDQTNIEQDENSSFDEIMGSESFNSFSEEDISIDEIFGDDEDSQKPFLEEDIKQDVRTDMYPMNQIREDVQFPVYDVNEYDLDNLVKDKSDISDLETSMEQKNPEDEVVKSEFIIGDGKGFYLVDFEDNTVLVGQIKDEIFILKRFDKKIDERLQARLNEKKGNSSSYMTKVGNYKALVEVTPQNMNLLIEL